MSYAYSSHEESVLPVALEWFWLKTFSVGLIAVLGSCGLSPAVNFSFFQVVFVSRFLPPCFFLSKSSSIPLPILNVPKQRGFPFEISKIDSAFCSMRVLKYKMECSFFFLLLFLVQGALFKLSFSCFVVGSDFLSSFSPEHIDKINKEQGNNNFHSSPEWCQIRSRNDAGVK